MLVEIDGHAIDYEERGEGRPIVLVHGLTTDRRVMIEACEPLFAARAGWRRLYLDLPGHGRSRGNPLKAYADGLEDCLVAFLRHVAPDANPAPPLIAYAYGAYLAQALPRNLPVAGLFLVCPVVEADFGKRTVPPRFVAASDPALAFSDDPREREAFLEVAVQQSAPLLAQFQRAVHPANIAVDAEVIAAIRYRYAMARPYASALQTYARPVAVACGRHDHWVGYRDALALVSACPRSSFLVAPDAGHLLPLEQPALFQAHLASWLERV